MDNINKRVRGADDRIYSSIRHFNGSSRDEQLDHSGLRDVRITASFFSSRRFGFGSLSPGVSSSLFFPSTLPILTPLSSLRPSRFLPLRPLTWCGSLVSRFGRVFWSLASASLALFVVHERKTAWIPFPRIIHSGPSSASSLIKSRPKAASQTNALTTTTDPSLTSLVTSTSSRIPPLTPVIDEEALTRFIPFS